MFEYLDLLDCLLITSIFLFYFSLSIYIIKGLIMMITDYGNHLIR